MGGLKTKDIAGRIADRMSDETYKNIYDIFVRELGTPFVIPAQISSKKDHGDIDIFLLNRNKDNFFRETTSWEAIFNGFKNIYENKHNTKLKLLGIYNNYPTISMAVEFDWHKKHLGLEKIHQIDFVVAPSDFCLFYYGNNDFGNLLGNLAKAIGLRIKSDGLFYEVFDDKRNRLAEANLFENPFWFGAENLISKIEYCLRSLGFDQKHIDDYKHKYFFDGFPTYEAMFQFIMSSRYFSKEIYQYDALNHKNKIRNKKRKTYTDFLDYLETQECQQDNVVTNELKEVIKEEVFFDFTPLSLFVNFLPQYRNTKVILKERLNFFELEKNINIVREETKNFVYCFKKFLVLNSGLISKCHNQLSLDYHSALSLIRLGDEEFLKMLKHFYKNVYKSSRFITLPTPESNASFYGAEYYDDFEYLFFHKFVLR